MLLRLGCLVEERIYQRYEINGLWLELVADCFADNILFNLPYDEERYQKTLEV